MKNVLQATRRAHTLDSAALILCTSHLVTLSLLRPDGTWCFLWVSLHACVEERPMFLCKRTSEGVVVRVVYDVIKRQYGNHIV